MDNDSDYLDELDEERQASSRKEKTKPRSRLLIYLSIVALVVFFLPNVILMTPLKHKVIRMATQDVEGTVVAESISGGWFQRIRLTNLQVADPKGNLVFQAEEVRSSKNLLALCFGKDLGTFEVNNASADVQLREGGSNFEDIFAKYLESKPDDPPGTPVKLIVKDSSLKVTNLSDGGSCQLKQFQGEFEIYHGAGMKLMASALSVAENGVEGEIELSGTINPDSHQLDFSNGLLDGTFTRGSASLLGAALTRVGYPFSITGNTTGKANVQWSGWGNHLSADLSQVSLSQSILASEKYIQNDRLMIGSLYANGKFQWSGNEIQARQLDIRTDFAKLIADGKLDADAIAAAITTGQIHSSQFEISGEADVARIAQMLPQTIHLHRDIRLTSGKLTFRSYCRPENDQQKLLLNAEMQNLVGQRGNQPFSWHHPVRIVAMATQTPSQTVIDELKLESNSFSLTGSGSTRQAELMTSGDLDQFAKDLSQVIDLSDWRMTGKFGGRIKWAPSQNANSNRQSTPPMELQASFRLANVDVAIPKWGRLRERQLDIQCFAKGSLNANQTISIGQGTAIVSAGDDQLKFTLTQPIGKLTADSAFAGQIGLKGELSRWFARAKLFLPPGTQLQTAGKIVFNGNGYFSRQQVNIHQSSYELSNWKFKGFSLDLFESKVAGSCIAGIDFQKSNCVVKDFTVSASSAAARVSNMQLDFGESFRLQGQTAFRGDLMKVANWFPSMRSDSMRYQGQIEGSGSIGANNGFYTGNLTATVKDAKIFKRQPSLNSTAQQNEAVVWHEPTIVLKTQFGTKDFDRIDFKQLQLQSKALAINASGSISDPAKTLTTQMSGTWHPNWSMISKIVQGYTGQQIGVTGSYGQNFKIAGPVFIGKSGTPATPASSGGMKPAAPTFLSTLSPDLKFETEVKWDRAQLVGFPLGQGRLPLRYQARVLSTDQMNFTVGRQGKVQVIPSLDLRGNSPALLVGKGSSVSNIELDPQICHGWIKYVAPPLADATRVQGTFSVSTDQMYLPLLSPFKGQAQGVARIHKATVSSGPLANQLITLAKSVKQMTKGGDIVNSLIQGGGLGGGLANQGGQQNANWIVMPEQDVPFRLYQQRVYHQGVTFQIDDVMIQTQGSVGADQSLQMIASIPVLDKWIAGKPWLQTLKGKSIQIPISGTLKNPRLDQNAIRQISSAFLKQNVQQGINNQINQRLENEVQKGLQKLFGK